MISKVKIAEARPMSAPARGISPWSNKLMFRTCPIVRVMTNMEAMLLKTTAAVDVPWKDGICLTFNVASWPAKAVATRTNAAVVTETSRNTIWRIRQPMLGVTALWGRFWSDQQQSIQMNEAADTCSCRKDWQRRTGWKRARSCRYVYFLETDWKPSLGCSTIDASLLASQGWWSGTCGKWGWYESNTQWDWIELSKRLKGALVD